MPRKRTAEEIASEKERWKELGRWGKKKEFLARKLSAKRGWIYDDAFRAQDLMAQVCKDIEK